MKKYSGFSSFNKQIDKKITDSSCQNSNANMLGELMKMATSLNFGGKKEENVTPTQIPTDENSIPQNLCPNNKLLKIMSEHDKIVKEIEKKERDKINGKTRKKK